MYHGLYGILLDYVFYVVGCYFVIQDIDVKSFAFVLWFEYDGLC